MIPTTTDVTDRAFFFISKQYHTQLCSHACFEVGEKRVWYTLFAHACNYCGKLVNAIIMMFYPFFVSRSQLSTIAKCVAFVTFIRVETALVLPSHKCNGMDITHKQSHEPGYLRMHAQKEGGEKGCLAQLARFNLVCNLVLQTQNVN